MCPSLGKALETEKNITQPILKECPLGERFTEFDEQAIKVTTIRDASMWVQ